MKKRRTVRKKVVKDFAKKLKNKRESKQMSREQVAEKANISPGTLQKIEDGVVNNPSITTVMDIVNSLEIKGNELVSLLGVGKMTKMKRGLSKEFEVGTWSKE